MAIIARDRWELNPSQLLTRAGLPKRNVSGARRRGVKEHRKEKVWCSKNTWEEGVKHTGKKEEKTYCGGVMS